MATFISLIPWINLSIMIYLIMKMSHLDERTHSFLKMDIMINRLNTKINENREEIVILDKNVRKLEEKIREIQVDKYYKER